MLDFNEISQFSNSNINININNIFLQKLYQNYNFYNNYINMFPLSPRPTFDQSNKANILLIISINILILSIL